MLNEVQHRRRQSWFRSRWGFVLGALASIAVLAAITFALSGDSSTPAESSTSDTDASKSFTPEFSYYLQKPLDGGKRASLQQADESVPYDVPMPSSEEANNDNLGEVFVSDNDSVAQVFNGNVLITYAIPEFDDAKEHYTLMLESGTVKYGHLDLVQDETALVMENPDKEGAVRGSIDFVKNGLSTSIITSDLSTQELIKIGESIEF